jgi:branched-subunit amino acid aminotransferase/4-amino-4-deoxychorismate lyase
VPLPAWLDDGPVDATVAAVSMLDAGLRSGIGVFETLRAHGTATLAADRHLARLVDGARALDIEVDPARVSDALARTLAAPRDVAEVAVRITVTAGPVSEGSWPPVPVGTPTLMLTLHPAPPLPLPAVSAVTVPAQRWPADLKATSYLASVLAQRAAQQQGADTAVLVDGAQLLETAEGSLLALLDGTLVTPPVDGRILAGVTTGLALEEAAGLGVPARSAPLRAEDLARADVTLVTSAVSGIRTLHHLDGRPLRGSGVAGEPLHPLVSALRDALEARRV